MVLPGVRRRPRNIFYEHNRYSSIQHILIELLIYVRHCSWPLVYRRKQNFEEIYVTWGDHGRKTYSFRNMIFDLNSREYGKLLKRMELGVIKF